MIEQKENKTKTRRIQIFGLNTRGLREIHNNKDKQEKVTEDCYKQDVIILLETHIREHKEDSTLRKRFEKKLTEKSKCEWDFYYDWADKEKRNSAGICIAIKKEITQTQTIEVIKGKDGRKLIIGIPNILEETLYIIAAHMPNKYKERDTWMKKNRKEIQKLKGRKIVFTDTNGIINEELDKIGGDKNKGTETKKEEINWHQKIGIDIWRTRNPGTVGWTRQGTTQSGCVKTRIDKFLVDEKTEHRIMKINTERNNYSDHDALTLTLDTIKRKIEIPYQRITETELNDKQLIKRWEQIYYEETKSNENIIDAHERLKIKWLEEALIQRKKNKRKYRKKDKKRDNQIKTLQHLLQWSENAEYDTRNNRKIKRYNYGMKLLNRSGWHKWFEGENNHNKNKNTKKYVQLGKRTIKTKQLAIQVNRRLNKKLQEKTENNQRRKKITDELERLQKANEDEKGTKFFYSKVNKGHIKETINGLKEIDEETKEDTEIKTKQKDILRISKEFYSKLWGKSRTGRRKRAELLENITKKLKEHQKINLDKKIRIEETEHILNRKLQSGKAPGWDGIPAQFYRKFDWAAEWLTKVYNEMIRTNTLTKSMKTAAVTVLYKKGQRYCIGNYRPISLLTDDYKIFTKILAERLKRVLGTIIQPEQQGFIGEGDIRGAILQVKEIIEYCNNNNIDAAIIFMDFQKAFDKVDHDSIIDVLKKFNFGPNFINMVKMLYTDVESRLNINGELSEPIKVLGGVRQGCPLSAYLFICVLELLASRLREDQDIKGITAPGDTRNNKMSLFADDAAAFVTDVENQIQKVRIAINDYEKATGGALNDSKTMILHLGSNRNKHTNYIQKNISFEVMKDNQAERYLGALVGNQVTEETRMESPLTKMAKKEEQWSKEKVGIHGRVLITNTLLLSTIKYRPSVNIVSKALVKQIQTDLTHYIWEKKRPRKKWSIMIQPYTKGGTNLKDIQCVFDTERIRTLQRGEKNTDHPWVVWKKFKEQKFKEKWGIEGEIINIKPNKQMKWDKNDLIQYSYQIWHEIGESKQLETKQNFLHTGIWWNPSITDNEGNSYYDPQSHRKGVTTIGNFLDYFHEYIKKPKQNDKKLNTYCNIIQKIQQHHEKTEKKQQEIQKINNEQKENGNKETEEKNNIKKKQEDNTGASINGKWIGWKSLTSKNIYNLLINKRHPQRDNCNHAVTTIRSKLTAKEIDFWWETLQELTFTNAEMFRWNQEKARIKTTNWNCPMCKTSKETREHQNGKCTKIKELWKTAQKEHNIGLFTTGAWNLTEKRKTDQMIKIAKLRYEWHRHRFQRKMSRLLHTNIDLVIDNWQSNLADRNKCTDELKSELEL